MVDFRESLERKRVVLSCGSYELEGTSEGSPGPSQARRGENPSPTAFSVFRYGLLTFASITSSINLRDDNVALSI